MQGQTILDPASYGFLQVSSMEWGLLAQTQAQSAASTIGLLVLSSCVLLMIYRPRPTELEGTRHDVPFSAIVVAFAWILIHLGSQTTTTETRQPASIDLIMLWAFVAWEAGETIIPAAAYLLPRSVARSAQLHQQAEEAFRQQAELTPGSPPAPPAVNSRSRFVPADWPQHIAVGVTVGLASLLPTALAALVLSLFVGEPDPNESHALLRAMDGKGWEFILPITLIAAVLAPLKEELLFRVILQGWFADRVGKPAIILSALVFAVIHGYPGGLLLVPLALILGTLYEYRRSYLEVVAVHATFNAVNLFAKANGLG